MRIYTENEVRKELNNKGYEILSEYTKLDDYHELIDQNNYKYYSRLGAIMRDQQSPRPFSKDNIHTIENINQYIINNNIETKCLSDVYKDNKTKMLWLCKCGNEFERSWASFQRGNVCTKCAVRASGKYDYEKTWEDILEYFDNKGYELLTKSYDTSLSILEYICPKHRDRGILETTWARCKSKNTGCPYCRDESNGLLRRTPEDEIISLVENKGYIYDHTEYGVKPHTRIYFYCKGHYKEGLQNVGLADLKKDSQNCCFCNNRVIPQNKFLERVKKVNPNISIIGTYISMHDNIECECLIDGTIWNPSAQSICIGQGCPTCARERNRLSKQKTHEEFVKEVYDKYGDNIIVLSQYTHARESVVCKCTIDNTIFEVVASGLVHSYTKPCPTCRGLQTSQRCIKTNDEFLKQLKDINPNIIPLEPYINDHEKILCNCQIHNYQWYVAPQKILHRRTGCPKCASYHNENYICNILDKWGYKYVLQKRFDDCRDINVLPFDIYIYDFNILLEYDGEGHYFPIRRGKMTEEEAQKSFETTVKHDIIKNNYCKSKKINLIRVPYWEAENMEYYLFDQLIKYGAIELVS